MKRLSVVILAMGVAGLAGAAEPVVHGPDFRPGYAVRPSEIVPRWSGANPGEWTFDYDAALAHAKAEGKYTLLLFSAMWWCPHCQPLEQRVLTDSVFQSYVKANGYYLTVVDFPYRNGLSNWCWLWDPAYRADHGIGDWSAEDVSNELIRRLEFQDAWSQNGAVTTNVNVLVEIGEGVTNIIERTDIPQTVYCRVGYPTIIVVRPDGTEAGRFSFNKSMPPEESVDYVIGNVEIARSGADTALFANPTAGGLLGEATAQYTGWLTDETTGEVAGSFTVKAGKRNKKSGLSKLSATILVAGAKKVSLSGTAVTPSTNKVFHLLSRSSQANAIVKIGANGFVGSYESHEGRRYAMTGGRNVFAAKDADAKRRAASLVTGFWTVATVTDAAAGEGQAYAGGSGGLSAQVKAKGKAKLSGVLGDGVKASASAQAVVGDDGIIAVPFVVAPYSKKGGLAFVMYLMDGRLLEVRGLSKWTALGKRAFTASCQMKHGSQAGIGALPQESLRFEIDGLSLPALGVGKECFSAEFNPAGKKWNGTGMSDETLTPFTFSLSLNAKTGLLKGTMTVSGSNEGKARKAKAKVYGSVVNGIGEGTAVFEGVGSFKVRITSACGGDGC